MDSAEETGITLLGTPYSAKLRALYNAVSSSYSRPIRVEPKATASDNSVEVRRSEIVLQLRPGSTEDNVAHELLHPILQKEGFPQCFSLQHSKLSKSLADLIRADLDHLIINRRLRDLGYDPHAGFLRSAETYSNVVKMAPPTDVNQMTIFSIVILHELLKYHYYIADPAAEGALLQAFPLVTREWLELKPVIDRIPDVAKPADLWRVAEQFTVIANRTCRNNAAQFIFCDHIGYSPVSIDQSELARKARRVFELSMEAYPNGGTLVRTFLRRTRIMVHAQVFETTAQIHRDLDLIASEYVRRYQVPVVIVSESGS